jgi:c-di-GMP-binding flagellar brake protein YcgR
MADPEAAPRHDLENVPEKISGNVAKADRRISQRGGAERRTYPRHEVDCEVVIATISGSAQMQGRLSDLSLGGCRLITDQRYIAGVMVRVEVVFQLRGVAFRFAGVTVGTRDPRCFAIRFVDMPKRRREELAAVLAEVAQSKTAKRAHAKIEAEAVPACAVSVSEPAPAKEVPVTAAVPAPIAAAEPLSNVLATVPVVTGGPVFRRAHNRHTVETSARLLLVKTGICMAGRIEDLSLGGCRIRTQEQFKVGIYVRVEAEFYLHGLPFRVGGVSQAIVDKNTIGVRFLDMSKRKRDQLTELIAEIAEAEAAAGAREMQEREGISAAG